MFKIRRPNDQHQRCEPAASERRIQTALNGWLSSAECFGWAISFNFSRASDLNLPMQFLPEIYTRLPGTTLLPWVLRKDKGWRPDCQSPAAIAAECSTAPGHLDVRTVPAPADTDVRLLTWPSRFKTGHLAVGWRVAPCN